MAFKNDAKSTPANMRKRLAAIEAAAESLGGMASRWNCKGTHAQLRAGLIDCAKGCRAGAAFYRERMQNIRRG